MAALCCVLTNAFMMCRSLPPYIAFTISTTLKGWGERQRIML